MMRVFFLFYNYIVNLHVFFFFFFLLLRVVLLLVSDSRYCVVTTSDFSLIILSIQLGSITLKLKF